MVQGSSDGSAFMRNYFLRSWGWFRDILVDQRSYGNGSRRRHRSGLCRRGKAQRKPPRHLTPGCRLQSLRSFRPTLARSRHLLRGKGANAAPRLRVRQPETLCENGGNMIRRPVVGRLEKPGSADQHRRSASHRWWGPGILQVSAPPLPPLRREGFCPAA